MFPLLFLLLEHEGLELRHVRCKRGDLLAQLPGCQPLPGQDAGNLLLEGILIGLHCCGVFQRTRERVAISGDDLECLVKLAVELSSLCVEKIVLTPHGTHDILQ